MRVIELIKARNFEKAVEVLNEIGLDKVKDHIIENAFESDDTIYCDFYDFLLERFPNKSDYYYAAAELYTTVFNYLTDGYAKAFDFSKKAIEIDPSDISLKEFILLFYNLPQPLLKRDSAIKYAEEVIFSDKDNKAAKAILESEKGI